jgi:hypothetical protein
LILDRAENVSQYSSLCMDTRRLDALTSARMSAYRSRVDLPLVDTRSTGSATSYLVSALKPAAVQADLSGEEPTAGV